jgi:8-amino-7-oxononanoate synthase
MPALVEVARSGLELAARRSLLRTLKETERLADSRVRRDDKEYVSFSCNDYLGLAHDPRVIAAARDALERFGAGAGASRLVTGNHPEFGRLERQLAAMKGTERALVFGSGYLANVGVIPALVTKTDLILADALSHACTWDGTRLSGATVMRFDHNSTAHCEALLREHRPRFDRCLILTETVFSMEGDFGAIAALSTLARAHDAWLLTDDAHGLGICSAHEADVQMGTLSKAAGSYGGYVCAQAEVIALLENKARTLLFATGLPPATVAAASAALEIIAQDHSLVERAIANATHFKRALGRGPASSPIVPVIVGEAEPALAASSLLEKNGLLVVAIRPPTVPPGTARLRFAFSASHRASDIDRAAALLKAHGYA